MPKGMLSYDAPLTLMSASVYDILHIATMPFKTNKLSPVSLLKFYINLAPVVTSQKAEY